SPGAGAVTGTVLPPVPAVMQANLRSVGGSSGTRIRFVNRSPQRVQIHWINFEGKRQLYATLAFGGTYEQDTGVGHVWLVTDEGGKGIAVFIAASTPGTAEITEDLTRAALTGIEPRDPHAAAGLVDL